MIRPTTYSSLLWVKTRSIGVAVQRSDPVKEARDDMLSDGRGGN